MLLTHFNGLGLREMKNDGVHIFKGRLFMFFASLLIASVSGTSFMFATWAHVTSAKTSLAYDQTTFNLLSVFKDLGASFGFLSGLITNILPPWFVLFLGSFINFISYFMAWFAFTGRMGQPHVWKMCAFICLAANSQTLLVSGSIPTCVKNFPEFRPIVSGLLKACLGLTSGIMTRLDDALNGDGSQFSLILLMAWVPALVSMIFMPFFRVINNDQQQSREIRSVLYKMMFVSFALSVAMMALIVIQYKVSFNRIEYGGSASLVVFLLFLPLVPLVRNENRVLKIKKQTSGNVSRMINTEVSVASTELAPPTVVVELLPPAEVVIIGDGNLKPPARGEDHTILQAIFSIDMAIVFVTITCCFGGTSTAIDNMGQIGQSLGYSSQSITTIISLASIWNYLGRLFAGFGSEYCLTKHKLSRPLILTFVNFFCSLGHVLVALAIPNSLYFSSAVIGFCLGAQLPLVDAIISDIFGLKFCSTLCNFAAMVSLISSYILKVRVAGNLYDKEGLKQMKAWGLTRKAGEELSCRGSECYRMAFIIILAASLLGFIVSCILIIRTWKFYRNLASMKGETNG